MGNEFIYGCANDGLPSSAFTVRRTTKTERMRELCSYAASHLGIKLDCTNTGTLEASIECIEDFKVRKMVFMLVLKTLVAPKYFCSDRSDISKYAHYVLGLPLFTHFTAPTRRYTDVIVHRQLEVTLSGGTSFTLDIDTIQKLARHCNIKKESACVARKQSSKMLLSSQERPQFYEALVVAVFEDYFDVFVLELNLERRIHLVWQSGFKPYAKHLTLFWKKGIDTIAGKTILDEENDEKFDGDELLEEINQCSSSTPSSPSPSHPSIDDNIVEQPAIKSSDSLSVRRPSGANSRRVSIVRERLENSTDYNSEQGSQTIKVLDKIRVLSMVDIAKVPPSIRILAANPFL
ncbi:MAG: hypothetical protein EXX96DRAFT_630650 [Benjaminiella poitrasii]|nr:MAG: hypothetical protein EXX96DRAFT_630650 [Benjaminiella poitrasii]